MRTLKNNCFIVLGLLLVSCTAFRKNKFNHEKPDYSNAYYWAALPSVKDSADVVPKNSGLKDEQENAKADVFYIHPTNYLKGKKWNANLHDTAVRHHTDRLVCKFQAGAFNNCCKVYLPRYRTAKILSYFVPKKTKREIFNIAYSDIKEAFLYYLKNYNEGRPFIIAAHSQGSDHAIRLCKEFLDQNSELNKKFIAAYLPGALVFRDCFNYLKPCEDSLQTNCYVTWNCVRYGELFFLGKPVKDAVCVNPLTWTTDTKPVKDSLNKGGVPFTFDKIDKGVVDAQISPNGLLWIHKPEKDPKDYPRINTRNYHFLDYNFFYMNIRENAKQRIDSYFRKVK